MAGLQDTQSDSDREDDTHDEVSEITTGLTIDLGIVEGAKGVRVTTDKLIWGVDLIHNIKGGTRGNAGRDFRVLLKGNTSNTPSSSPLSRKPLPDQI